MFALNHIYLAHILVVVLGIQHKDSNARVRRGVTANNDVTRGRRLNAVNRCGKCTHRLLVCSLRCVARRYLKHCLPIKSAWNNASIRRCIAQISPMWVKHTKSYNELCTHKYRGVCVFDFVVCM